MRCQDDYQLFLVNLWNISKINKAKPEDVNMSKNNSTQLDKYLEKIMIKIPSVAELSRADLSHSEKIMINSRS